MSSALSVRKDIPYINTPFPYSYHTKVHLYVESLKSMQCHEELLGTVDKAALM